MTFPTVQHLGKLGSSEFKHAQVHVGGRVEAAAADQDHRAGWVIVADPPKAVVRLVALQLIWGATVRTKMLMHHGY